METLYKIIDGSSKKRVGKTIKLNNPVSSFVQNDLLKEYFINVEFENKSYSVEMVTSPNGYITSFLRNQDKKHGNSYIQLTLENL